MTLAMHLMLLLMRLIIRTVIAEPAILKCFQVHSTSKLRGGLLKGDHE